jgi:hypothetical protein
MTEMTAVETSKEALEEGTTKSSEAEFDNGKEEPEKDWMATGVVLAPEMEEVEVGTNTIAAELLW